MNKGTTLIAMLSAMSMTGGMNMSSGYHHGEGNRDNSHSSTLTNKQRKNRKKKNKARKNANKKNRK